MEKSRQISKNLQRLDEYREKSDTLLYSMIPRQIATRLKNGEKPVDTCQVYSASQLFSLGIDRPGFTV